MIAARLNRTYDPELLVRDLNNLRSVPQAPQPGPYHDGDWTGMHLYDQAGGDPVEPHPQLRPFGPTPALTRAPYLRELIADLPAPKLMVRLLTLPAASEIGEHNDAGSNFRFGSLRLHVPVVTHPDVIMMIDGERMSWRPGELWWGDFSRRHWLRNDSPITRVHLVIDVEITGALLELFPAELVAQWRESPDGISEHRQSVAVTPAELERFRCGFRLPSALSPLFGRGAGLQQLARDTDAVCRPDGEQLAILLDGEPACALRRTGARTFAVVGRPPGVFVEFDSAHDPSMATFVIRGVPEDLYAAQLGFQQGPLLAEQRFELPLTAKSAK